jgi:putative membrane protein
VFSHWDQAALAALVVLATVYAAGTSRLALQRVRRSRVEVIAFSAGIATMMAAVLPLFDAAVIRRFSAHMAQHELMMLIGAPLLVASRPLSTCLWAFPERWRHSLARPLQTSGARHATQLLTAPLTAWALHGLVVWSWHFPRAYDFAIQNEAGHALQHAMFTGSATLFWWGLVYGRYGRAGYGAGVFYVFSTVVHTGILGAIFTFARVPLYDSYATSEGSLEAGVTDQQLAGLLMWIPAGILLTLFGIALFAAWLGESERRQRLSHSR